MIGQDAKCCGRELRSYDFECDRLGRMIQVCPRCGNQYVTTRGTRTYDQGETRMIELGRLATKSAGPVDAVMSARAMVRRKAISVIGKDLAEKMFG